MINKIIDGISEALFNEFGSDYTIYTENVSQGLDPPCFFIRCLSTKKNKFMGDRYFRENLFAIQYLSNSKESNQDFQDIFERLSDALELISADGDMVRGTNAECDLNEDILTYKINYNMFSYKKGHKNEKMGEQNIFMGVNKNE